MPTSEINDAHFVQALAAYLERTGDTDAELHLCGRGAVAELEAKLRAYYGMRYALCVPSATTGLLGLAMALGLEGAEFVTTPYTYGGSLSAWLLLGNRPIFADITPDTLTLDPDSACQAITTKTKALLAVDIYGVPSDMVRLRTLADEYGIWYIADAAQSFGARRSGLPASQSADALVISLTAGKPLSVGEGGAVLTDNRELYEKLIWYTQHPYRQRRELGLSFYNECGINGRIHPLAAVWANATFETALSCIEARRRDCFAQIGLLNDLGYTAPIRFREEGIEPSFFRLAAAWHAKPRATELSAALGQQGFTARIEPAPVRLVYRQADFLAQYGASYRSTPHCPEAERQVAKRFCLSARDHLPRSSARHDGATDVAEG